MGINVSRKKILILCPYPEGVAPSQRLKYEQYFDAFRNDGWHITVSPFICFPFWKIIYKNGYLWSKVFYTLKGYINRITLLFKLYKYDLVYVHLWGTPFGPPLYEYLIRRFAKKLIYDIDDLVYLHGTQSKAHPLVTWIKGRRKPIYLMRHADHVITCTPFLDKFVRKYNPNTTDISSTVDTDRYIPVNQYTKNKKVRIGWSGSLTTSRFFLEIASVLKRLVQNHDIEVFVMGDPQLTIPGVPLKAVSWTEKDELKNLQSFDIGVYPLPDEEWVYGKSGLKAIQYMALGIPTVATAIGANFRVIESGVSGFLVKSEEEWVATLERLIEDPDLRREIGLAGRRRVEEQFSTKANKETYLKILNGV